MEKTLTCVFFLVLLVVPTASQLPDQSRDENNFTCNNTYLQAVTNDTCSCHGNKGIGCEFECYANCDSNLPYKTILALIQYGYNNTEAFSINIKGNNLFGVVTVDIRGLSQFKQLRVLSIISAVLYVSPGPAYYNALVYDHDTFTSCDLLETVQIEISPKNLTSLGDLIKPLKNLQVLDLHHTKNLGSFLLDTLGRELSLNITILKLSYFQDLYLSNYQRILSIRAVLSGIYEYLTFIDFSQNAFEIVTTGWFEVAPNLKYLDISNNLLVEGSNTPFMIELLMHPSIQVLNLSNQIYFQNRMYESGLSKTKIWTAAQQLFTDNANNQLLSKPFLKCIDKTTLGNISVLFGNESSNFICKVLRTCFLNSWANLSCDYLPDLATLVDFNCLFWMRIPIGQNIKELILDNVALDPTGAYPYLSKKTKVCLQNNNLRWLQLSGNPNWLNLHEIVGDYLGAILEITGTDHLETLILQNNTLDFNLFQGGVLNTLPKLKTLDMSNNDVVTGQYMSLCRDYGLGSLEVLDISHQQLMNTELSQMLIDIISQCHNVRTLRLSRLSLDSSFTIRLHDTADLEMIDMSHNNMDFLSESLRNELSQRNSKTNTETSKRVQINLAGNNIVCDCSDQSLYFLKWLKENKDYVFDFDTLACIYNTKQYNVHELDYTVQRFTCLLDILIGVAITLGFVVITAIFIVIYKTRFRLKHKCFTFEQFLVRKLKREGIEDNGEQIVDDYKYDAFVAFSSEDRFWVHDVLAAQLEEKHGFRLLIHVRDFLLGNNIQSCIHEGMSKSRKFIVVMTQHFLDSQWCALELEAAHELSLKRGSRIAIIVLGELPQNICNPTAAFLLDTYNYLQWKYINNDGESTNSTRRKLFWSKLVHYMYENEQTCCCCWLPTGPAAIGMREIADYEEISGDHSRGIEEEGEESLTTSDDSNIPLI